jgi:hypothetical protein
MEIIYNSLLKAQDPGLEKYLNHTFKCLILSLIRFLLIKLVMFCLCHLLSIIRRFLREILSQVNYLVKKKLLSLYLELLRLIDFLKSILEEFMSRYANQFRSEAILMDLGRRICKILSSDKKQFKV